MRTLATPILRLFDLEVHRYRNSFEAKRTGLLASSEVDLVLDVGANTGQYACALRSRGFTGRIVSFEPLPDAFAKLERKAQLDPLWEARQLALGDRDDIVTMNVSKNSVSSSILPMRRLAERAAPDSRYIATCDVPMARLDSVVESTLSESRHAHLKLDVQGAELQVLQGAIGVLPHICSLDAEMSLVPLYEGQELMPSLVDHVRAAGFELIWLERGILDPRPGYMLQLDGLFCRPNDRE
jgi:FkbM family methyltransferase